MTQKKVLVVGAGLGQLPAIQKVQNLGHYALTIDQNPNAVGMSVADISKPIDITDIDSALSFAKSQSIDGVLTLQSDIGVRTVGEIVSELDLPGVGKATAEICSDKHKMQGIFDEKGVPSPTSILVNTIEDAQNAAVEIGYPCLIKPANSSGSRGVSKIESEEDIKQAYLDAKSNSLGERVVLEEYIDGLEVGAQAFSKEGSCELVVVHNDTVTGPPHFVPVGHSYPSQLDRQTLEMVEQSVKKGVESLGIHTGPSNIDLIIDEDGQPKILEIAARIGATCLPELTTCYTGIDWVGESVCAAIGEEVVLDQPHSNPCAALVISAPSDGILSEFNIPKSIKKRGDVVDIKKEANIGDEVSILRDGPDRIGKVVVEGDSWEESEKKAKEIISKIIINVE